MAVKETRYDLVSLLRLRQIRVKKERVAKTLPDMQLSRHTVCNQHRVCMYH